MYVCIVVYASWPQSKGGGFEFKQTGQGRKKKGRALRYNKGREVGRNINQSSHARHGCGKSAENAVGPIGTVHKHDNLLAC